jgi:GPN-loop GTPase
MDVGNVCFFLITALLYAVQFMLANVDWIIEKIDQLESGTFVLIDCPGQVELFTHDESMRGIVSALLKRDLQLACVNLLDSFHCRNIFHYLSGVLISLSSMLRLELPHVNVLSKIDLVETMGRLPVDLEYYLDLTRVSYLLETEYDLEIPESEKSMLQKLAEGISEVVEEFSLVSFMPLDIMNKESVFDVLKCVDRAAGYLVGEENDRLKMMAMTSALQDDILDKKYKEMEKGLKESEESE